MMYRAIKLGARAGVAGPVILAVFFVMFVHEGHGRLECGVWAIARLFKQSPVIDTWVFLVFINAVLFSILLCGGVALALRISGRVGTARQF